MKKWPNFFIVGAPKAGTTTLYHYLNEFPEIYFSKLKEPHYFSRKILTDYYYEDVHILEKNLGRTLPWSNFQN